MNALLANGVLPVVTSNYLSEEMDCSLMRMSALTAGLVNAKALMVLGDQENVRIRKRGKGFSPIGLREVSFLDIDTKIRSREYLPVHPRNEYWRDLQAAGRMSHSLGIPLHFGLCDGSVDRFTEMLEYACKQTVFLPDNTVSFGGVRRWLCAGAVPNGTIVVSALGAQVLRRAEHRGSLLSKGLVSIEGKFEKNDVVNICDENGALLGYGMSRYSSEDMLSLLGKDGVVIIHADYLYCTADGLVSV